MIKCIWKFNNIIDDIYKFDFEDLYVNNNKLYYKKSWKIFGYKDIDKNWIDMLKKEWFFENKQSYSLKKVVDWKKIFFRIARSQNQIVIRKLWFTFDFFRNFRHDKVLFEFVTSVLKQQNNKSLLISWLTGSWKTTFILSLLEMINNYTYKDIVLVQLKDILDKQLKSKKINIDLRNKNIQELKIIINDFLDKEEKKIIWEILNKYLKEIWIEELLDKYNNNSVYTIEKPIEYYFENKNLIFWQNEIEAKNTEQANELYTELVDIALQSNPDIIYISEIKNRIEYQKYIDIIFVWPTVIASNHANSVFWNLRRLEAVSENKNEIKEKIANWLWWLLNLKRYEIISLDNKKPFVFSYEFLKFFPEEIYDFYVLNNDKEFKNKLLLEERNKNYYLPHSLSLIFNIYVLYKKWYNFILKLTSWLELQKIVEENAEKLAELYNVWYEETKFVLDKYFKLEEEYKKSSKYNLF